MNCLIRESVAVEGNREKIRYMLGVTGFGSWSEFEDDEKKYAPVYYATDGNHGVIPLLHHTMVNVSQKSIVYMILIHLRL